MKKEIIVKECYGYCRLHKFFLYTTIEKYEVEDYFIKPLKICWIQYSNTVFNNCDKILNIKMQLRDLMGEHCDLLNKHMDFRRDIKRNQKKIKIFSKHHNLCKDIQCLILDFIVKKPNYII